MSAYCTLGSAIQILLYIVALGAFCTGVVLASRFRERLESQHPAAWRWLGQWNIRWIDGEIQEAALPEYIWTGMYKSLNDTTVNVLALKGKVAVSILVLTTVIIGALNYVKPDIKALACIASLQVLDTAK